MILTNIKIEGLFNKFNYDIQLDKKEEVTILYGLNGIGKTTILNILFLFSHLNFIKIFELHFNKLNFKFGPYGEKMKDLLELNVIFTKNDEISIIFNIKINDYEYEQKFSDLNEITGICLLLTSNFATLKKKKKILELKLHQNNPSKEELISIITFFIYEFQTYHIESLRNSINNPIILEEYYQEREVFKKKFEDTNINLEIDIPRYEKQFKDFKFIPQVQIRVLNDLMNYFYKRKLMIISQNLSTLPKEDEGIQLFIKIINNYFDFKKMSFDQKDGILIVLDDEIKSKIPFPLLSSGEKNLLIIFYEIIFEAQNESLILIDEPEISLNINWHYDFIDTLREVAEERNLYFLIATHSPQIVNNYTDNCVDADYKEPYKDKDEHNESEI